MTHTKNKVGWCLKKAEKELEETGKHRGLIKLKPDIVKAKAHVTKAEHYLKATIYLNKENFSDISASTIFYCLYHCLLAISIKFGYESKNQECTFALIQNLIEDKKINLEKSLIDKIASFDIDKHNEKTSIELREHYQYGTELSLQETLYQELLKLAKEVLSKTKVLIEQ